MTSFLFWHPTKQPPHLKVIEWECNVIVVHQKDFTLLTGSMTCHTVYFITFCNLFNNVQYNDFSYNMLYLKVFPHQCKTPININVQLLIRPINSKNVLNNMCVLKISNVIVLYPCYVFATSWLDSALKKIKVYQYLH